MKLINKTSQGGSIIVMSLLVAMILMLMPLPDSLRLVRPEWVVLVLIYWTMAAPQRVGVGYAWLVGLVMDLLMGGPLGVLAFSYALICYIVMLTHLQIRQYPIWQQAMSVFSLILLMQMIFLLLTPLSLDLSFGLPALSSTLLWPVTYAVLRSLRRTFHVS